MNATELLSKLVRDGFLFHSVNLVSPDGTPFRLSVQGSEGHYCYPRERLGKLTGYTEVEVGVLSADREFLAPRSVGLGIDGDAGEPCGYVSLDGLVAALDAFFAAGGTVEPEVPVQQPCPVSAPAQPVIIDIWAAIQAAEARGK